MKKVFLMIMMVGLITVVSADIPRTIHHQGRLTNLSGEPVPDGSYVVNFKLFDAATGGLELWSYGYTLETKNGYYNVELGSESPTGLPASLTFDQPYYLELTVSGGSGAMTPRLKLNSSAYAMNVADGAITNSKLSIDAVTSDKIANGSIVGADITTNLGERINSDNIEPWSLVGANIADTPGNRIMNRNIEDNAIDSRTLADGAVSSQAKAPWAPRVFVGNWRTNPIIVGNVGQTDDNGNLYVDLSGYGFTTHPVVVCTVFAPDNTPHKVILKEISISGFYVTTWTPENFQDGPIYLYWIAIGK